MFHHTVLFRWKPGTSSEQVDAIASALRALPSRLTCFRSYSCGPDLGLSGDRAWDFGVVGTFDDEAGWKQYRDDPEHGRIRDEMIMPLVAEGAVVQFEG